MANDDIFNDNEQPHELHVIVFEGVCVWENLRTMLQEQWFLINAMQHYKSREMWRCSHLYLIGERNLDHMHRTQFSFSFDVTEDERKHQNEHEHTVMWSEVKWFSMGDQKPYEIWYIVHVC